jgi:F0F1-type ATP synthase membrane subunit b/b'
LQGLADHVAQSVFQVAGKVLSREVRPEDHRQLIQESIKNLPSKN